MSSGQTWCAAQYLAQAGFVPVLGASVLELLAPQPGERILDLGCGEGSLTARIVEAGAIVLGVDASPALVEAARAKGLNVRLMDGQALAFDRHFDAVFSNAALHWMPRMHDVIVGVARALVPGGRYVAECGGSGNVALIRAAINDELRERGIDHEPLMPWVFPTPGEYATALEAHGFVVDQIGLVPRPTPLPGDVVGWLETFAQAFTAVLPEAERPAFLVAVRERLRPQLCSAEGQWYADYVRLRFQAHLAGATPGERVG